MRKWCDHCRSHWDKDHYPDGYHGIGFDYGPYGAALLAEEIVRGLADEDPPTGYEERGLKADHWCLFCDSVDDKVVLFPSGHKPSCPWRRAKEWVESYNEKTTVKGE